MSGAVLELDELDMLEDAELIAELRAGEIERRRLEARQATVTRLLDRRNAFRRDGHTSIKGLLRVVTNRAPWEITTLIRTGDLMADQPDVAAALHEGRLGVAQANELATARFHPRCGDTYPDVADVLLSSAIALPFRDLRVVTQRWVNVADEDGADQRAQRRHADRDAYFHLTGDGYFSEIHGGTLHGEAIKEIHARYIQIEWEKDWAQTVEQHGAEACPAKMPRTDAQRRHDAFVAIVEASVCTPPGAQPPEPVVNILCDPVTFARILARIFGIHPQDCDDVPAEERRCETSNGNPVAPVELAAALLAGHVRRVVMDSRSVVIDMGRKMRLFTGNARTAAHMGRLRCIWPGCEVPAARCETDHLLDWNLLGTTCPDDGEPCCPHHNLFKLNNGYTISRDASGRIHVYRPDGTEVA